MGEHVLPRYPVYIPSKGRYKTPYTARVLLKGGVPFHLVVEPQEADLYAEEFGYERVLVLPFSNRGLIASRNWIKEHAIQQGAERHWQLDDNIRDFWRRWRGKRIPCEPGIALRVCEDFTDRYENIAVSGLNYEMFVPDTNTTAPLIINCHVYSCSLINNAAPFWWRLVYNDDTDLCLQALAGGWCTVLLNAFLARKIRTMVVKGGNTQALYQGDGRLKMARQLERVWPYVVTTERRFHRPQHVIRDAWKKFDTPLQLKPGIDLASLPPNEYGMELVQVKPEVKSPHMRALLHEWQELHEAPVPAES